MSLDTVTTAIKAIRDTNTQKHYELMKALVLFIKKNGCIEMLLTEKSIKDCFLNYLYWGEKKAHTL